MRNTLLPPNATGLERALADTVARLSDVPVGLRPLWSPQDCPAELLPYLAWAFSVDRWNPDWSIPVQRDVIANAFYVHRHKGTISALRRVVEPLGYLLEVTEWWEQDPPGIPGTFALAIGIDDGGITDATYTQLTELLDDARPLTRQIVGLDVRAESNGRLYIGASIQDGDVTAVFPYIAPRADSAGAFWLGVGVDSVDALTVYPQQEAAA